MAVTATTPDRASADTTADRPSTATKRRVPISRGPRIHSDRNLQPAIPMVGQATATLEQTQWASIWDIRNDRRRMQVSRRAAGASSASGHPSRKLWTSAQDLEGHG